MSKPFQRKTLQCTEEQLFMTMLLRIGPPPSTADVLGFVGTKWFMRSTTGFFAESKYGRAFVKLLSQHGEAKSRAALYLTKYRYWCAARKDDQI